MRALSASSIAALALLALVAASGEAPAARHRHECGPRASGQPPLPPWVRQRRTTVLVDSVLLGGMPALRAALPRRRIVQRGRPAIMLRAIESEIRRSGRRVAPLVILGVGYNSLWQRRRQRYGYWAARFDREAGTLLRTLARRGARQFVWVTLRQPTRRTVPPRARGELGKYSWYFPYVNERLRRLDRRRSDLVLADWRKASDRPGLTYDSIHLNPRGAALMGRTIRGAICAEARLQAQPKHGEMLL